MKTVLFLSMSVLVVLALVLPACGNDQSTSPPEAGEGVITGALLDATSGGPLSGVGVTATIPQAGTRSVTTGADGKFEVRFPVDSLVQVSLTFRKSGYGDTTLVVSVRAGGSVTVQFRLVSLLASQGPAVLAGVVTDGTGNALLAGVRITAQGAIIGTRTDTTNLLGRYRFSFNIDSTDIVVLRFAKTGYRDTSLILEARTGITVTVPVVMRQTAGGSSGGDAQTIAFLRANPQEVSVFGVGGQETSTLDWEVRDSVGLPITAARAVDISFSIAGGVVENGYLSPQVVRTNASGRASTTFNSGTRSGVVQIVAAITVGGRTIASSPVRVTVRAGFPDQAHFSVGAERHNFPAIGILGRTDGISVLVGDKYSNPVALGTAIYFRSSAGVIQPTVFTNADGQGTANLISGNPEPFGQYADPSFGNAYHYVVARTIGQGGVTIIDSTLMLWSGRSLIRNVTPTTFALANEGAQEFTFQVSDVYDHPLAAGTTITVTVTVPPPPDPNSPVNQAQLVFGRGGSITLEDEIRVGQGTTQFGFRLSDGTPNINVVTAATVSITVLGPNGSAYYTINGTVR